MALGVDSFLKTATLGVAECLKFRSLSFLSGMSLAAPHACAGRLAVPFC